MRVSIYFKRMSFVSSSQICESVSSLRRHHHAANTSKHDLSSSSNEEQDECFSQGHTHKSSSRRQQYSSTSTSRNFKCSHTSAISSTCQPDQCPHCFGNFTSIKTSSSSIPLSSSTAAGSAVVLQSVSSSSSLNLSTSKAKHENLVESSSLCNTHHVKSKPIKVVPLDNNSATNLPISSPISPSSSSQFVATGMKKIQEKKLSSTPGKQKKRRTKLHGDRYGAKLQVQQKQPSPLASSQSYNAQDVRVLGASTCITCSSTSTSTSDSCSGKGRKASTSSSSTGSCTNLTSQLETTSFLITDSATANDSITSTAPRTTDELKKVTGEVNQRPSVTSYCSATEDDVSTIM